MRNADTEMRDKFMTIVDNDEDEPVQQATFSADDLHDTHPLFSKLPESFIVELMNNADVNILEPGEILYKSGNTNGCFYISLLFL